jgi:plastocyanin
MKGTLFRRVAAAALLLAAACGEAGTLPPTTASVVVEVAAGGSPVAGALIHLSDSQSAITGADGRVVFEGVAPGEYAPVLRKLPPEYTPGAEPYARPTTVVAGQNVQLRWNVQVAAPAAVVESRGLAFVPATVRIRAGEAVRFDYVSGPPHTVTPETPAGHWVDRPHASPGDNFTVSFQTPGTYRYLCTPHATGFEPGQGMTGVVIVE